MSDTAKLVEALREIETLSDNCTNAERYGAQEALEDLQAIRRVIARHKALASITPSTPARVKSLEWTAEAGATTWGCDAPSFGTYYRITQFPDEYELSRDCVSLDEFETLDEAKAAAQEDYADLVRDCLEDGAPPAPALWAPVAGRIGLTRDGRKVTGLMYAQTIDAWTGWIEHDLLRWLPDGRSHKLRHEHLDLVAEWTEVQG